MTLTTGNCVKCKRPFEYRFKSRKRSVCDDCIRGHMVASVRRIKSAIRNSATQEMSNASARMRRERAAAKLRVSPDVITFVERSAFAKIRNNPEARRLFEMWKEEGFPMEASERDQLRRSQRVARDLTQWNLTLARWWHVHDKLLAKGMDKEARQCRIQISKFFKHLQRAIRYVQKRTVYA